MTTLFNSKNKDFFLISLVVIIPLVLAIYVLNLTEWDLSVPLIYRNSDDIWQLVLTKVLNDTGWVLTNPFLGAPDVASWHHNAAAQTSALHSFIMLGLSLFIDDAVKIQQVYYLLNFSLISLTSFVACRLLDINKFPAFCVGLLFSFTTFRINEMLYAFLSNYFMIPLAIVPIVWIMSGVFSRMVTSENQTSSNLIRIKVLLTSKQFILGLLFIVLMAFSDGYYAFFTLLLLGFATLVRILSGDWKSPLSLLAPLFYIVAIFVVSLALIWPLHVYKESHRDEFFPNGVQDTSMVKHAFEAEVYSTTLKMLMAPIPKHHIESLGAFGKWVVETSDGARAFKNGRNLVPLGTLASCVFVIAIMYLCVPSLRRKVDFKRNTFESIQQLNSVFLSLILFIFLSSILGGIGTLIALIFPDIRAYDRFPLFLIFVLYVCAANAYMNITDKLSAKYTLISTLGLGLIAIFALYDQIPRDAAKGDLVAKEIFLSERKFVKELEVSLPSKAMIYQYPYSQYLRQSKYYGWGSFSHVRLYLHSKNLRWSNGAAKNSAVENWHIRLTQLPLLDMLNELQAVGFRGMVIDNAVLSESEYSQLKKMLKSYGMTFIEDAKSKLTFTKFKDSAFFIEYDKNFKQIDRIVITNLALIRESKLPILINELELNKFLDGQPENKSNVVITRIEQPQIFLNGNVLTKGIGESPILPLTDMSGEVSCEVSTGKSYAKLSDTVILTFKNNSTFDWKFDSGSFPIRVGIHLKDFDNKLIRWDDGLRVSANNLDVKPNEVISEGRETLYIRSGSSGQLKFPLSKLNLNGIENKSLFADFRLVQDGHAWFEHLGCKIQLDI